jgi:hypothetical protein
MKKKWFTLCIRLPVCLQFSDDSFSSSGDDSLSSMTFSVVSTCCAAKLMTCARQRTCWSLLLNWICFFERSVATAWRKVTLLLALSVVTPRIYIKDYLKFYYFFFKIILFIKKLTLDSILKLLKLFIKASLILFLEWIPLSLIKFRRRLFSSHLFVI